MTDTVVSELLSRRVEKIFPSKEGLTKFMQKKPRLRLYQGFDPSSPNLHIGHLVGLLQLKAFQDAGHEVIFLIGDFTGMIGDPTDKTAARKKLSRQQVLENAKTYKQQAGRILRFSGKNPARMMFNSTWLESLTLGHVIDIASHFTVQQMIERDMFVARLKAGKPIFLHEFIYPLMVTYDAKAMKVDLEIGGNDQMFNMTVGRNYLKNTQNQDKYAMTLKLLTDSSGNKIGKTTGNAINLFGPINDLYGEVMALPDNAIINTFILATNISLKQIAGLKRTVKHDPMAVKKQLAYEIVRLCHSPQAAEQAQTYFETTFQKGQTPTTIPPVDLSSGTTDLLELLKNAGLPVSSSQIKRVIKEGGVEYNGKKITDPATSLTPHSGDIIRFGKHTFRKVVII